MAETQKAKIARLERELEEAKEIIKRINNDLMAAQEKADEAFGASPAFQQLKSENERLRQHNKILESRLKQAAKKSDAQIEMIERIQRDGVMHVHNARGAGRKPRFTPNQVDEIKNMRASGFSLAIIAQRMDCSVGLVHKLINEDKGNKERK